LTGTEIYQQSIDKQRILVAGGGSNLIASLIVQTLRFHNRKFDVVASGIPSSIREDSPIIIVENCTQPIEFKHHIIILGNNALSEELTDLESLVDATPKGGTIIFPKAHATLKKIGSKERPDVQSIGYEVYKHDVAEGKTVLISSSGERFPVELSGDLDLQCVGAAKELLKKIGITSGNFYRSITEYKPSPAAI